METPNERAVAGHNNPPPSAHAERFADIVREVDELAAKGTGLPLNVATQETADSYLEVIKLAKKKAGLIDDRRKEENRPLDDVIKGNNAFFRALSDRLGRMADILTGRTEAFYEAQRAAERKRLAEEAAERQRIADAERERLEEARAAGGVEAEIAEERQERLDGAVLVAEARALRDAGPVRSAAGTVGTRTNWDFRVKDFAALDLNEIRDSFGVSAIEKALRDHVRKHKNTRPLKGVEFFETSKLNIR